MTKTAVIDRIVDGKQAVLLVGEEEKEYIVPLDQLPQGAREGGWVEVVLKEGSIQEISLLEEETRNIQKRIEDKMGLLRARESLFKRKE